MRIVLTCLFAVSVAGCTGPAPDSLALSALWSDNAVVQRDAPVNVWGWAEPGVAVSVTFADQSGRAETTADGRWQATLEPMPAGGPHDLQVTDGTNRLERTNLMVGDVWIASGQSNMEWPVINSNNADAEIAAADDPGIRHFKVPRSWSFEPEERLAGGEWEVTGPETVGQFTAVGYYFARELREHVGVPVGIINTSWGGSRIEPWMSADALGMDARAVEEMAAADQARVAETRARIEERVGPIPETDQGLVDGHAAWADPDLDTASWTTLPVPAFWEEELPGLDGIAWYRLSFQLTAEEAAGNATLGAGRIDDSDITWVNGHEVGRTENAWQDPRVYVVPAEALLEGSNVIAVRVEDTGGGGGIYGQLEEVFLETVAGRRSLATDWQFRVGAGSLQAGGQRNQMPTLLYNKMVQPLLPWRIAGYIWYQGESNAGGSDAVAYSDQFRTMISTWREDWGQGDLPFFWVQLANFMAADEQPQESDWAVLRESQTAALELPATGQAVIIDIGEANDIHPRNKQDVGYRLALAARHTAYGEDGLVYSGPMYRSHRREGPAMVIEFDHVGGGLVARGDALGGFAIAGPDGRFRWARASIQGGSVVVSSPLVSDPRAVRYAWANNPVRANLYNAEGLPASPFRTDSN